MARLSRHWSDSPSPRILRSCSTQSKFPKIPTSSPDHSALLSSAGLVNRQCNRGRGHGATRRGVQRCQEVYFRVWPDGPKRLASPLCIYWCGRSGSAIATSIRTHPSFRNSPSLARRTNLEHRIREQRRLRELVRVKCRMRYLAAKFIFRKATTLVMESLAASGFHLMWPRIPLAAGSI